MNDTVKMFLISLITAVLVQVLLGPQIMKMQQAQGLLPPFAAAPVAGTPGPVAPQPATPPSDKRPDKQRAGDTTRSRCFAWDMRGSSLISQRVEKMGRGRADSAAGIRSRPADRR